MKEIQLSQDKVALVDDIDFAYLNQWKWCLHSGGYATRRLNEGIYIYMHRIILPPPIGMQIDHINHNGLDNRRCNLRICTMSQNIANSRLRSDNTSKHKGIYWNKNVSKWQVAITFLGKEIYLGIFDDIDEASQAYAKKAKELFGEFANAEGISK